MKDFSFKPEYFFMSVVCAFFSLASCKKNDMLKEEDKIKVDEAIIWYQGLEGKKSTYYLISAKKDTLKLLITPKWDSATVEDIGDVRVITAPIETNLTRVFGEKSNFNIVLKSVGKSFQGKIVITNNIHPKLEEIPLKPSDLYSAAFSSRNLESEIEQYTELRVYGIDLKFQKAEYYSTSGRALIGSEAHKRDFLPLMNKNGKSSTGVMNAPVPQECVPQDWYLVYTEWDENGLVIDYWEQYLYTIYICPPGSGGSSYVDCAGTPNGSAQMTSTCGCVGGASPIPFCIELEPRDDCGNLQKVKSRVTHPAIAKKDSTIVADLDTLVERGAEHNATSWAPGTLTFKTNPVRISQAVDSKNEFDAVFSWNSTNGYTIGVSHGHTAYTGPSPADVFWGVTNLSNPDLIAAGLSAINFYKNNFMISTITQEGSHYTVMINDWNAVQTIQSAWANDPSGMEQTYLNYAHEWFTNNPPPVGFELDDEATTYALAKIFGNSISIAKALPNSKTFKALELAAVGKNLVQKNCGEPIERRAVYFRKTFTIQPSKI